MGFQVQASDINWGKIEERGRADEHREQGGGRESSRGPLDRSLITRFTGASRLGRFEIGIPQPNSNVLVSYSVMILSFGNIT